MSQDVIISSSSLGFILYSSPEISKVGTFQQIFQLLAGDLAVVVGVQQSEGHVHVVFFGDDGLFEAAGDELGVVDRAAVVGVDRLNDLLDFAEGGLLFLGLQSLLELLKAQSSVAVLVDLLEEVTEFKNILFLELGGDQGHSNLLEF